MVPWHSQKARVQLKLAAQRLTIMQEKKLALAKQSRREIADLVTKGRIETARLRVETLIGDDIHVELLEIVELYTETLSARFALLDASKDAPDPSLRDAVCAIIYAAPHTELKELHLLREMLMQKFGRTFALSVVNNDPPCVPPRVLSKLAIYVPPPELVDMYLQEIARGYGINWTSDRLKQEEVEEEVPVTESVEDAGKSVDKDEQTPKDGKAASKKNTETASAEAKLIEQTKKSLEKQDKPEDAFAALTARFDALKKK
ncbi:regulator of Vps4 activity in the MVB pathway-domain-containing protein [Filobasidium floriforme]|uniref:regulator of Vps4 activity in the MVB pathway-domain-containing protein n=1 Tax=Filobasidium floriforme TaxID=5210 RepID=UPI001E8DC5EB|nr:regulator of Vps4 activity in the MVB pathway-domain-containing protein [Filobasidium floriforme]KAH8090590.1 regulator of Vps4 activity in the MVB pathway-domain-containing protein [Filobasidium floriforme]